jgi:hypothetical protein
MAIPSQTRISYSSLYILIGPDLPYILTRETFNPHFRDSGDQREGMMAFDRGMN